MSEGSDPKVLHKIYTSDPLIFKSYVNKQVTITTEDSIVHTGVLYTVDPVSERYYIKSLLFTPKVAREYRRKVIFYFDLLLILMYN